MGRFEQSERFFFYPEGRTYSPLPKTRRVLGSGGISTFVETVRSPRVAAPSEPCGSRRRAVTFRAVVCPSTALSTLYHSIDSVGIATATPNFFFIKRNKNLIERLDKVLWRFII